MKLDYYTTRLFEKLLPGIVLECMVRSGFHHWEAAIIQAWVK